MYQLFTMTHKYGRWTAIYVVQWLKRANMTFESSWGTEEAQLHFVKHKINEDTSNWTAAKKRASQKLNHPYWVKYYRQIRPSCQTRGREIKRTMHFGWHRFGGRRAINRQVFQNFQDVPSVGSAAKIYTLLRPSAYENKRSNRRLPLDVPGARARQLMDDSGGGPHSNRLILLWKRPNSAHPREA